jgi:hypothetical protein
LFVLFAVAWVSIGYWISCDAAARGSSSPHLWGFSSALCWPIAVYYLVRVRRAQERIQPSSRHGQVAQTLCLSAVGAAVVGTVITPPDPVSQATASTLGFAIALPVTHYTLRHHRETGLANGS